jgi:ABC-type multidrug transport system permease subunit
MGVLFAILAAPFRWLPFCSLPGAVAGSLVGFMFAILQLEHPALALTPQQLVLIGLLLGVTALLVVLFLFGVLLHYGVLQIFWAAVLNVLVTAELTVWVDTFLGQSAISALVGLLIGVLVGFILCWLCRWLPPPRIIPAVRESSNGQA